MTDLIDELRTRLTDTAESVVTPPDLIARALHGGQRRRARRRVAGTGIIVVVVAAATVGGVVIAQRPAHETGIVISPAPSPTASPSPSPTSNLVAVAQSVLGSAYSLVDSKSFSQLDLTRMLNIPGTIQRWRTSNGDVAQITWQPDNPTLYRNNRPNGRTASGEPYYLQRAVNGQVEIVIFGGGNAVIYSVADLRVNPNNRKNGYMVTNLPSEKTLIRQAAQLLTAS